MKACITRVLMVVGILLSICVSGALAENYSITDLGPVSSGGKDAGQPERRGHIKVITNIGSLGGLYGNHGIAINNAGQATGSYSGPNDTLTFLYSKGVMVGIGTLGGDYSHGAAINSAGEVVGDSSLGGEATRHAFLYSKGTMTDLGTLGGDLSWARGINNRGQVVGASYTNDSAHAFLYSGGLMTDLGTLGGYNSVATGINNAGQVVGYSQCGDEYTKWRAFLYTGGTMIDLGTPGDVGFAYGINDAGQVIGDYHFDGPYFTHAFLYSDGVMTDLGTLDGDPASYVSGINNVGQVVGNSYNWATDIQKPFFYNKGVMINLNTLLSPDSDWKLTSAMGINESGQIIGFGRKGGITRAFIMTPRKTEKP